MTFVKSSDFTDSRSESVQPVYRRNRSLSNKDYKVIQIKDKDRRIRMILQALPSKSSSQVFPIPLTGVKIHHSPVFGQSKSASKGQSVIPQSHNGTDQPNVKARKPLRIKRKTQPLVDSEDPGCNPKKPCFTLRCPAADDEEEAKKANDAWFTKLGLSARDVEILDGGEWLTDDHISAAQKLLRRQFPALAGLQEPVLGEILQLESMKSSDGVQVLMNGGGHWVTVCKTDGAFKVLDSENGGLSPKLARQIDNLSGLGKKPGLRVQLPAMHPQRGSSDCGVFALAYTTEVAFGGSPELAVYDQKIMRRHLRWCLESQRMAPFPRMYCSQRTLSDVGYKSEILIP